jgi:hypothetical protein
MIATIVVILLVNVAAIFASLPCLRPLIVKCVGTAGGNGVAPAADDTHESNSEHPKK